MPGPDQTSVDSTNPSYIRRIEIDRLFGYFNYVIPGDASGETNFSRLLILYGDNGSGKTTILKLLFSLLAPYSAQGEKSYVARTPFKRFAIFFDEGTSVLAEKGEHLSGSYSVIIRHRNLADAEVYDLKTSPDGSIRDQQPLTDLFQALGRLALPLYFLPDDRRVRSTFGGEERLSDHILTVPRDVTWRELTERRAILSEEDSEEPPHINISEVLARTSLWFRSHAFRGSNMGEENATSIYLTVVEQIAALEGTPAEKAADEIGLVTRLQELASEMQSFTKFGLIPSFPADRFLASFADAGVSARRTIATVLVPYVDGIEARLKALEEIRDLLAIYVETTNSFLASKSIEFTPQSGMVIRGFQGVLDPNLLSSGEKQLLLLLSNTILARERAGIFLIDEPELSLNVKWQRRLVDAILGCARGSRIQYVLASHSLELITVHKGNAVRLPSAAASTTNA
jgi:energy-coupling factor transporter ATP-binding protein EcfA2